MYLFEAVKFVWDPEKDLANLRKHGVDFTTAAAIFDDPCCLFEVDRVVDGEERWHAIGNAGKLLLLLVVHTVAGEHEDEIRIISARKVARDERGRYQVGPL